jgi:hypothetical protein
MRAFAKSIVDLRSDTVLKLFGRPPEAVDPDDLLASLAMAASRDVEVKVRPLPDHVRKLAIASWQQNEPLSALTRRQIRALADDPDVAISRRFIEQLSDMETLGRSSRIVSAVLSAYFARWTAELAGEPVAMFLRRALRAFAGRPTRLARCGDASRWLMSDVPQVQGAKLAIEDGGAPATLYISLGIPEDTGLGPRISAEILQQWAERASQSSLSHQQRGVGIDNGFALYFDAPGLGVDSRVMAVERLLRASGSFDEASKDTLRRRILGHREFGDPRLPRKGPGWAQASLDARRRMLTLLVGRDLRFFFNAVVRNDPLAQRRRDFWLQYEERVEAHNVALCVADESLVQSTGAEKPFFSRLAAGNAFSAFIMRFGGRRPTVVVEFSAHGNAAYVYEAAQFDELVPDMYQRNFFLNRHLKVATVADRWVHRNAGYMTWERNFAIELARREIRP